MSSSARPIEPSSPDGIRGALPLDPGGGARSEPSARVSESGIVSDRASGAEIVIAPGTVLGGRYMVDGELGEGGMGILYVGHHVELGRPVAIKFLRRDFANRPSVVQRFINEGRSAAALRSEYVVRVLDVGQLDSGRPYLVMEHLEGTDLDKILERDGAPEIDRALEYVLQVCTALVEAHGHGIVHRDIKPENLFLVASADRPLVKVLDFGLAKRLDAERAMGLTGPQDSMGSPFYMSPEQIITPQDVDARTDIWSLGVVLYRLLTGKMPFAGDTMVEVYAHVINAEPVPPSQLRPEIGQELEDIVLRSLRKDVGQRYATIAELAQDLGRHRTARQSGASLGTPSIVPAEDDDSTPIAIPGLRRRWPAALLAMLALGAGALYLADRGGRIDARHLTGRLNDTLLASDAVHVLTDGWLTAPRMTMSPDVPIVRTPFSPYLLGPSSGVFVADRGAAPDGVVLLPAEREREAALPSSGTPEPVPATESGGGQEDYERYLKDTGMVPLKEALERLNDEVVPRGE